MLPHWPKTGLPPSLHQLLLVVFNLVEPLATKYSAHPLQGLLLPLRAEHSGGGGGDVGDKKGRIGDLWITACEPDLVIAIPGQ